MIKYETLCDLCGEKLDEGSASSDECSEISVTPVFCDGICNNKWTELLVHMATLGVSVSDERKGDK